MLTYDSIHAIILTEKLREEKRLKRLHREKLKKLKKNETIIFSEMRDKQ